MSNLLLPLSCTAALPAGWESFVPLLPGEELPEIESPRVAPEEVLRGLEQDSEEAIVRWTPDGIRVMVNAAYARRFGCAPELLIGENLLSLLTE